MTAMLGRREFLGTAAAAGLLAGCKFSNNESAGAGTGDLAKTLQGIADEMLAEYPQNATILGIATGKLAPLNHQWQDQTPTGVVVRRKAIGFSVDYSSVKAKTNYDAYEGQDNHNFGIQKIPTHSFQLKLSFTL